MTIHHLALVRDNRIVNVALGEADVPELLWLQNVLTEHDEVVDLGPADEASSGPGVGWGRKDASAPFEAPPELEP